MKQQGGKALIFSQHCDLDWLKGELAKEGLGRIVSSMSSNHRAQVQNMHAQCCTAFQKAARNARGKPLACTGSYS